MNNQLLNPVIILLGPTAVGKTELSIRLAKHFDGEIISADSRLFYRGMDIGTAKPSLDEMAGIPHHLIDVANPDEVWSLGKFKEAAKSLVQEISARGKLPFVVGGTGQYVRALTEGWDVPELTPQPELRAALEHCADEIGKSGLYNRLKFLDPQAAKQIDYRNLRRTIRALEVILSTGKRFSEQRIIAPLPYRVLQVGLQRSREELYQRVDARIEKMLLDGLIDEIKQLNSLGYLSDLRSFSAIGYREISAHLAGEISLEEAIVLMKRNTRVFVRRQTNWFKPDNPEIHWFDAGKNPEKEITKLIKSFVDFEN